MTQFWFTDPNMYKIYCDLCFTVHLNWFYWAVSSQPNSDIKRATELPGNFYFLSVNYMLLSTLIWLLIHLLSLAIAFQRPLIGPFSLMKLEYWYFTVTSCPQRVTDPVTTRWCRGCELYLTGTFHLFSFFYLFFSMRVFSMCEQVYVWNSFCFP